MADLMSATNYTPAQLSCHMKKLLLILFCICFILLTRQTKAQTTDTTFNHNVNVIFGNLDKTKVPFGLLRDYAMEFTNLENFNGTSLTDSNRVDAGAFKAIHNTLAFANYGYHYL